MVASDSAAERQIAALRTPNRMTCGNSGDYVMVEPRVLGRVGSSGAIVTHALAASGCIWSPAVSSPPTGPHAATRTTDLSGS